jgi:hypothetical protein
VLALFCGAVSVSSGMVWLMFAKLPALSCTLPFILLSLNLLTQMYELVVKELAGGLRLCLLSRPGTLAMEPLESV